MKDKNGNSLSVGDLVTHPNYVTACEVSGIEYNAVKLNHGGRTVTVNPSDCTLMNLNGMTGNPYDVAYRKGINEGFHKARQYNQESPNWWGTDQWQYDPGSAPKGVLLLVCTASKTEDEEEELNFVAAMRVDGEWVAAHGKNGKILGSIKCWMRFPLPKIIDISVRIFQKPE